jgi:hypothetical protein
LVVSGRSIAELGRRCYPAFPRAGFFGTRGASNETTTIIGALSSSERRKDGLQVVAMLLRERPRSSFMIFVVRFKRPNDLPLSRERPP